MRAADNPDLIARLKQILCEAAALEYVACGALQRPHLFLTDAIGYPNNQTYVWISPAHVYQIALDLGDVIGVQTEGVVSVCDERQRRYLQRGDAKDALQAEWINVRTDHIEGSCRLPDWATVLSCSPML